MSGDHNGFCCADCAAAAARGEQAPCDGETCKTAPTGAAMFGRPDPLAMVGGMPGRRAQTGALPAGRATGCATCGAVAVMQANGGRSTGCGCAQRAPANPTGAYVDPLASKMPMGMRPTGKVVDLRRARGYGTGAINLSHPTPFPPSPHQHYLDTGTRAQLDALDAWLAPHVNETADEARQRARIFYLSLQLNGESDASYSARISRLVNDATTTDAQLEWLLAMSDPAVQWLPMGPADIAALNRRRAAMAASPGASGSSASGGGSSGSGSSGGSSSGGGSSTTSAQNAANQQAVINGVTHAIESAGSTVLSLVREANQHDAEMRAQAANTAAANIARQDSREAMLVAAVREATGAMYDAQTALRMLQNGDRTGAISQLSAAQGRLAGAIGTSAAFPGSAALTTAIANAQASVQTTASTLDRTASSTYPTSNPLNDPTLTAMMLQQQQTPWWKQPLVWVGTAILGGVALLAGRRSA